MTTEALRAALHNLVAALADAVDYTGGDQAPDIRTSDLLPLLANARAALAHPPEGAQPERSIMAKQFGDNWAAGAQTLPAAPPDFKAWLQSACDAVEEALLDHRLSEWVCEDDETSNFPLLDHLSHNQDTGSGRREIEMIVETIFFALEKHGPFGVPSDLGAS